jgi:hypothetical protein
VGVAGYVSGSTFDGRYVYLIVNDQALNTIEMSRYDTRAPFVASSFEHAPMPDVLSNNTKIGTFVAFRGATFDGQFVYLAPNNSPSGGGDVLARLRATGSPVPLPAGARSTFF